MQEVCDGGKQQGLTWNFQTYLLPHPHRLKQKLHMAANTANTKYLSG